MDDKHEFEGKLQLYYETGMEGYWGTILQDNRGITPNPQYDPTKTGYPFDIPEFHSLSYCVWFRGGEELEVYAKDGITVEYRGPITKDRMAMIRQVPDNKTPMLQFIPREVPKETWFRWFAEERKAKAWSAEPPMAEDPRYADHFKKKT